jgi:hypothetical protein
MFPYKMLICWVVFGATIVATPMVCAETAPTDPNQDQDYYIMGNWQTKQKTGPGEQFQFFAPPKPSTEQNYLILDRDGQTPSDYRGLLDEPPQTNIKPSR